MPNKLKTQTHSKNDQETTDNSKQYGNMYVGDTKKSN